MFLLLWVYECNYYDDSHVRYGDFDDCSQTDESCCDDGSMRWKFSEATVATKNEIRKSTLGIENVYGAFLIEIFVFNVDTGIIHITQEDTHDSTRKMSVQELEANMNRNITVQYQFHTRCM